MIDYKLFSDIKDKSKELNLIEISKTIEDLLQPYKDEDEYDDFYLESFLGLPFELDFEDEDDVIVLYQPIYSPIDNKITNWFNNYQKIYKYQNSHIIKKVRPIIEIGLVDKNNIFNLSDEEIYKKIETLDDLEFGILGDIDSFFDCKILTKNWLEISFGGGALKWISKESDKEHTVGIRIIFEYIKMR